MRYFLQANKYRCRRASWLLLICLTFFIAPRSIAQSPANNNWAVGTTIDKAKPLDEIFVMNVPAKMISVVDGTGREYFRSSAKGVVSFRIAAGLGTHKVFLVNARNEKQLIKSIEVDARTTINDGGYYRDMFHLFYRGMFADADAKDGTYPITWNNKTYRVVVPWTLDNFHTNKGLQYFLPNGRELVDIMRQSQREDGMIYSFIQYMPNADYFLTRDKWSGYSKPIGDKVFVRQPTENHPEYIYVNTIYACWKTDADDKWMQQNLSSAASALDYCQKDPARWSKRFGLLKRVYTIDSWDFAVEDEYMPDLGITNSMVIDPVKSKFGVFFGDNTGYITACYQLSEMYQHAGDQQQSLKWKKRGDEIRARLDKLAWNGRFFTHFIDEDSTVKRQLGVDEKTQLAQSNAYSLNRSIDSSQSKAIIKEYIQLKGRLPEGSPGEWYAIYPPFQKGFGAHNDIWQYMNGGVGGHVAGELALGAYNHGYERYGTDILHRLFELGKKYDNKIWFAYTGAMLPPPPAPEYKTVSLANYANMDITNTENGPAFPWMLSKRPGDDLQSLPTGSQQFAGIRFNVINPSTNNRKAVVAISRQPDFPASVEIPINANAGCVYLLHTSSKSESENIVGHVKFNYDDGSEKLQYLVMEKQLTYWWFSQLKTDHSGIAWYSKNKVSEGVGLSWCALNNPSPNKKIKSISFNASAGNGIYTLFGLTLSDREHYVPVKATSYGGPDNWAASTAMAAMVQGLAGVDNGIKSEAFANALIAPRWASSKTDSVAVTIRFAASRGYVSYNYLHQKESKQIRMDIAGSGRQSQLHLLLPANASAAREVLQDGKPISFQNTVTTEGEHYVDAVLMYQGAASLVIRYQ